MKPFFRKNSKNSAKERLLNCIKNDRENTSGITFDRMFYEIEGVLSKYFDIPKGFKPCVKKQTENLYTLTLNNLRYKVR